MGKIGGNRNYGYGKQIAWAGSNVLNDRYGHGHFSSKASHENRWKQFADYLKSAGINDVRKVNLSVVEQYGRHLRALVAGEEMSIAYAQNLLSTVNVVMETMRKDKALAIKPAQWVGKRSHLRTTVPATLERSRTDETVRRLCDNGQVRIATVAELARSFGLRFREASLLNAKQAVKEAKRLGRINITQGTKGGRGNGSDRWIPVDENQYRLLSRAERLQDKGNNLIPPDNSYIQWRNHAYYEWGVANKDTDINGFHDMRAAYACERYQDITGFPASVVAGKRQAEKALDTQAKLILSQELGHNRLDVIAAYIGSSK